MSFHWTTFDVTQSASRGLAPSRLRGRRQRGFPRVPRARRSCHAKRSRCPTSERGRVRAHQVRHSLPGSTGCTGTCSSSSARESSCPEQVDTALDERYGVVLNVQFGTRMRFECHVDSNPLTGLLLPVDHPLGGGELVFAHNARAARTAGGRPGLLGHPPARRPPDLLRRRRSPALCPAADRGHPGCASSR